MIITFSNRVREGAMTAANPAMASNTTFAALGSRFGINRS
jgi:hypothetical protein